MTGTVAGFSVETATSVSGLEEFAAFHEYYWADVNLNSTYLSNT